MKMFCEMLEQKAEALLDELDAIRNNKQAKLDRQTKVTKQYVEDVQR